MRTRPCDSAIRQGRWNKALDFKEAFEIVEAFADAEETKVNSAAVTLAIHAGIAGADVICCIALGYHSTSENHNEAIALLNQVDRTMGKHLKTLLDMKTIVGYTHNPTSANDLKKAKRAMEALIGQAQKMR